MLPIHSKQCSKTCFSTIFFVICINFLSKSFNFLFYKLKHNNSTAIGYVFLFFSHTKIEDAMKSNNPKGSRDTLFNLCQNYHS